MATSATTYEGESSSAGMLERGREPRRRPAERRPTNGGSERLARALGWFSVGLGLAEVAAPRRLARLIGIADTDDRRMLLRALGLRELASGTGILRGRRPAGWLWSRVGGDALDLGLLGRALRLRDANRTRVTSATLAVAGVTALDMLASERLSRSTQRQGFRVRKSVTIERSPEELYQFWHDFQNLPRFMRHLESVRVVDGKRSHWKAKGPAGTTVEWDAEIVDDQPNRRIAWRSVEGAPVSNRESVEFVPAPGGRGTIVRVEVEYDPPGGTVGAAIAQLFGEEPSQQIAEGLRRMKQLLETGEIPTAKGPAGRRRPTFLGK